MTYESPITLIRTQTDNFIKEINNKTDEVIFKAVVNVLPQVDKDELVKALAYDREQYCKSYKVIDSEIVRCKDCKEFRPKAEQDSERCRHHWIYVEEEDFCSYGERRKDETV